MTAMSDVPRFIPPQLPSLTDRPPEGANWLHEVKHDGYRTILVIERGKVGAYTRNGFDWSDRYPGIIAAAAKLECILDGEVIVQDERGVSDFESLRFALYWQPHRLIFYAFDLLHLAAKTYAKSRLCSGGPSLLSCLLLPMHRCNSRGIYRRCFCVLSGMCGPSIRRHGVQARQLELSKRAQQDLAQE
jgi:hypothetical protein